MMALKESKIGGDVVGLHRGVQLARFRIIGHIHHAVRRIYIIDHVCSQLILGLQALGEAVDAAAHLGPLEGLCVHG